MRIRSSNTLFNGKMLRDTIIVSLGTLMLASLVLHPAWHEYQQNTRTVAFLEIFHAALVVEGNFAAERDPSSALMLEGEGGNSPSGPWLADFRGNTDKSLDHLGFLLARSGVPSLERRQNLKIEREHLAAARAMVDKIGTSPGAPRPEKDIQQSLNTMFAAFDSLNEVVAASALVATENNSNVSSAVIMSRNVSLLRDFSGRVVSFMTPALLNNRKFEPYELRKIYFHYGRNRQIISVLDQRLVSFADDKGIRDIMLENQRNIQDVVSMIDAILEKNERGEKIESMDKFHDTVSNVLTTLESLRDRIINVSMAEAISMQVEARNRMLLTLAISLGMMTAPLLVAISVILHLIRPLLAMREHIRALATGRSSDLDALKEGHSSLGGELVAAILALRERERRRLQLSLERETINSELRAGSQIDALTGCLTRHGMGAAGRKLRLSVTSNQSQVVVMVVDIDHFKQINETYGRLKGDAVLQGVAERLKKASRKSDFVVRFGGEEFLVVLVENGPNVPMTALNCAEKLRHLLCDTPLQLEDDLALEISASIGIAIGLPGDGEWEKLLTEADQALQLAKQGGRNQTVIAKSKT